MSSSVIVIGAGPAGLTVSAELMRRGRHVLCLEKTSRAGGMIGSHRDGGFLAEQGPHSLRIAGNKLPAAFHLAGVETELVFADPRARKRFVTRGGKPVQVPAGPGSALTSPLISTCGKLRFLREPFAVRGDDRDESLANFVRRRLGPEALDNMVDAVVGGIFAGDPEQLAVRHAFPALYALEQEHGSLIRGALRTRKKKTDGPPRIVSFKNGMRTLTEGLATRLGDALKTNADITRITQTDTGYTVEFLDVAGKTHAVNANEIIITVPPHRWCDLGLPAEFRSLADFGKERVPNPPVAIVTLGFKREDITNPLDGFGVLSPSKEKRAALGVVFASTIFPNRAPDGHVTLAFFIGGMRSPEYARRSEAELIALANDEARTLLGAAGPAIFSRVSRQEHAIPQYDKNHGELIARIEAAEMTHPGIHFAGNFRGGIALPATLENAVALAEKIAAR